MRCDEHVVSLNGGPNEEAAEREHWKSETTSEILVDESLREGQLVRSVRSKGAVLTSE